MSALTTPLPAADREQLADLYARFQPQVLRWCLYLLGSPEEAEDATSEIFARLSGALRTYDPSQRFRPWLARVTSNYCVDLLRRRRSEQRVFEAPRPDSPETAAFSHSPLEEFLREEQGAAVREALATLPEHYRQPIIQRYWGELGYGEIAKNLGLTRANVATLIFRAKEGLRQALALNRHASRATGWALYTAGS